MSQIQCRQCRECKISRKSSFSPSIWPKKDIELSCQQIKFKLIYFSDNFAFLSSTFSLASISYSLSSPFCYCYYWVKVFVFAIKLLQFINNLSFSDFPCRIVCGRQFSSLNSLHFLGFSSCLHLFVRARYHSVFFRFCFLCQPEK